MLRNQLMLCCACQNYNSFDMFKIKSTFSITVPCSWNRVHSYSEVSLFLSGKCLLKAFEYRFTIYICVCVCIYVYEYIYLYILFHTADDRDHFKCSQCCIGYHSCCALFSGPCKWSYIWKLWNQQLSIFTLWSLWLSLRNAFPWS